MSFEAILQSIVDDCGGGRSAALNTELVLLRFGKQRLIERGIESGRWIVCVAQGGAQIDMIVLAEAHIDPARAGHAHPVAAGAEIVRQRGDEAELAAGLFDADIARRSSGAIGLI